MPTISAHLPDGWKFTEQFISRISAHPYRGKPGPYIRDLIERDLIGQSPTTLFTPQEIDSWHEDEAALYEAHDFALKYLHNSDPAVRAAAAARMAEIISRRMIRQPTPRRGAVAPEAVEAVQAAHVEALRAKAALPVVLPRAARK